MLSNSDCRSEMFDKTAKIASDLRRGRQPYGSASKIFVRANIYLVATADNNAIASADSVTDAALCLISKASAATSSAKSMI